MWKRNRSGYSRPTRNAILSGNDRSKKDSITFREGIKAGDFLAALVISPSEVTFGEIPGGVHHSWADAAEFVDFMGNRWNCYWGTQLQLAVR